MQEKENVILFPKMKEKLMKDSFNAIEAEDFATALQSIDVLIDHDLNDTDIAIGKIICHVQLGQEDEAIIFCEDMLEDRSHPSFYTFLFYYVTILFEANQYGKIIHYIDEIEEEQPVPEEERIKYIEIYEMCQMLVEKEAAILLNDFYRKIQQKETNKAFIILKKWNTLKRPFPSKLISYVDEDVHEGIKSYLWQLMIERKIEDEVSGVKFGHQVQEKPMHVNMPIKSELYKRIEEALEPVANDNPVMEQFLLELTNHFLYMYMPLDLSPEVDDIVDALLFISKYHFTGDSQTKGDKDAFLYVEKIMEAEAIYTELFIH